MTCQDVAEALADYLSGELPPETRQAIELHLPLCPDCMNYVATYKMTICLSKRAWDQHGGLADASLDGQKPEVRPDTSDA